MTEHAAAAAASRDDLRVSFDRSSAAELTILTKDDPADVSAARVGHLFATAPDSVMRVRPRWAAGPEALLGSMEPARVAAARLTRTLTDREPPIEGVRQLAVFQEIVLDELTRFHLAARLDQWLAAERISGCRFLRQTPWAVALQAIQRRAGSAYSIRVEEERGGGNLIRDAVGLVQRDGVRRVVRRAVRRAWPLASRVLASRNAAAPDRGGWWFYTTAYNYTRVGLAYERYMPRPLRFVVEDDATGGRALAEEGRTGQSLYSYGRMGDRPSRQAVAMAAEAIIAQVKAAPLDGTDALARDCLLEGAWFSEFLTRLLPLGLLHSRIAARWIECARPEMLVVGNTAFEGYLLQPARAARIPTLLLQHGNLAEHFRHFDEPADHLVVTSRFFREFLAPANRARAVVLGLPRSKTPRRREGRALLFVTAYYAHLPFCHESDLEEILRVVAQTAASAGRPLLVRVHPLETVESYRRRLEQIVARDRLAVEIEYSQGGDPDAIVQRSAAAVLFWSTMFIDCVRWGVPIVSPGWHDFNFKSKIAPYGIFHFADSLAHLADLVSSTLDGRLGAPGGSEVFDTPATEGQLSEFFSSVGVGT